jgi:hypothetical protein
MHLKFSVGNPEAGRMILKFILKKLGLCGLYSWGSEETGD